MALYPAALGCGILPALFWASGLDEVLDLMDSWQRRRSADLKRDVRLYDFVAYRIADLISYSLSSHEDESESDKPQPVEEWFPGLFEDELEELREQRRQSELALHKARMRAFAEYHNAQYRERRHEDDTGRTESSD